MTKLYLIRHGKTIGNLQRLHYGRTDLPLAQEGREELARRAACGCYPAAKQFFTSGMRRTEETLELIYGPVPHGVLPGFREFDFGEYEMKSYEELKDLRPYQLWITDETGNSPCPGGESNRLFHESIFAQYRALLPRLDRDTAVVCHGGVIGTLLAVELFPEAGRHFIEWLPQPGGGYAVTLEGGKPVACEPLDHPAQEG